jgi:hypothetical protein
MTDKEKQDENYEAGLSADKIDREIVYYYSREKRLNRASPSVSDLNEVKPKQKGSSSSVFPRRSNLITFVTIIMIFVMFNVISRLSREAPNVLLGGNRIEAKIFREEGSQVLEIIKSLPKEGEFYTGYVDIIVSPVEKKLKKGEVPPEEPAVDPPVPKKFLHRINFNAVDTETYRVSLPFEENDFYVIFLNPGEQKSLRVKTRTSKRSSSN